MNVVITFETVVLAVFVLYALAVAVQLFFYLFIFSRVAWRTGTLRPEQEEAVSVVICGRDEANRFRQNLPLILEQDYPAFEVVVVDDCSDDDTDLVLAGLKEKYPHLIYTTIRKDEKFRHGKKLALTIGIKAAKNDILLLTDADCTPASNQWIRNMVGHFTPTTEFVLGYGGYQPARGFLNTMIRLDTLFIAMQYLGYALAGRPYMGVGRNLAYRRSTFFNHRGFANHSHIDSGDDDLFVNHHAVKANTRVALQPESHTRSEAEKTVSAWFRQKRRHLTSAWYYKPSTRFLLIIEPLSRYIVYAAFVILLIWQAYLIPVLALFAARLFITLWIFKITATRLKEKNLFILYPLVYEIGMPLINLTLVFMNLVASKKHRWK